jgi:hypothetical protein
VFVFSILTIVGGVILGLHCRVFALLPVILLIGVGTSVTGILGGRDTHFILLSVAGVLSLLQISYLAGSLLQAYLKVQNKKPYRPSTWAPTRHL